MTRILRNIFILSLILYLSSTSYVKLRDSHNCLNLFNKVIYSLPWDAFPLKYLHIDGKDRISTQIGILSSAEVAKFLKANPDQFPNCYEGTHLNPSVFLSIPQRDYLVLRFKNKSSAHWGDIKCYFSCFSYPCVQFVSFPYRMPAYYNVIIPYPEFLEKNPQKHCEISVRWKNSWGRP